MNFNCRCCSWGVYKPTVDDENIENENPDVDEEEREKEKEQKKEDEYNFIVSGAIGHGAENPEVKVWRVESDKLIHMMNLNAHSLGIVSVDVSPNGKCKKFFSIKEF